VLSIECDDPKAPASSVLYEVPVLPRPLGCSSEQLILRYLRSGDVVAVSPGILRDVLDDERPIIGSPKVLTDGVWTWPGELAYYVERYHIELPGAFVERIQSNAWRIHVSS